MFIYEGCSNFNISLGRILLCDVRLFLKRFIALCHASCQLVRTVLGVIGEQDRTCVIRWCNASEDKASRRFLTFPKRLTACRAVTGSRRRAVIKHGLAWCSVVTLCRTVRRRNYLNIICLLSHQFPSLRRLTAHLEL